jgi:hypothetical protein
LGPKVAPTADCRCRAAAGRSRTRAAITRMLPSSHGQLLSGTQGLPLPESDPKCLLTPDPPACPGFIEGDSSGRATPTYATLAGRGLFEKLCDDVASKLRHVQEHQQEQDKDDRRGLGGKTTHSSLRQAISAAGPPVKPPQPTILSQGQMLRPPAEVQSQPAALGPPLGLGEPPSAARGIVSVGSLGHPYTCNEACKYLKRKSGCLLGTSCNRCHLCHWHRKGKEPVQPVEEHAPPPPAATHPRPPTRPTGTAPRAATAARAPATPWPPLSAAPWLAEALHPQLAVSSTEPAYVHVSSGAASTMALGGASATTAASDAAAERGAATISQFPSLGSVGHPHSCGRACKYAGKTSGCKVGHLCNRCHLCHWTRSKEHSYAAGLA